MTFKSLVLGASLAALSATSVLAETWNIAVTDVEGMERLQTEWGPFKDALEAATGDTFDFFPVNSRTAAADTKGGTQAASGECWQREVQVHLQQKT